MDREQLAARNLALAARRHRLTWRERLRRALLRGYARLPAPRAQPPTPGLFLLIRPDHVGDVLLSMPALQALRRARPDAQLVALAGPWSAEALAAYPEIDLVLTLPFPGFARGSRRGGLLAPYRMAWRWAGQVRQLAPETALILRPDHWWGALLAYLAGVPHRVGFDLPDVRPFLTAHVPHDDSEPTRHAVLQGMALVEQWVGTPDPAAIRCDFPVSPADVAYVDDLLAPHAPPGRPIIAIHPGAGSPIKRWPPERWAAVADRLSERLDAPVIFTGSDQEHAAIWQIMDAMRRPAASLAGETSIGQLAALYARAAVALGPDTGPLHLAVAVGAPTVHLYGPADPAQFGPWGDPARHAVLTSAIGCRPCRVLDWAGEDEALHPCIRDIPMQHVIEAALRVARATDR